MTQKLYALVLTGQGDTDIKLVEKDVWDWIMGAKPKQKVPKSVLDKLREHQMREGYEEFEEPYITPGSPVNDAALYAPAAIVDGKDCQFFSVSEYTKFVKKHDIDIVDDFEGCIY